MLELIDDETTAYIIEQLGHFEELRQVAAQLAGLLVLAASGSKSAAPDHPMLAMAERSCEAAVDGVRHGRPTERARPHHDHLLRAAEAIETAIGIARGNLGRQTDRVDIAQILAPLRNGYRHLQHAADLLPGFELVEFNAGCCRVRT